MDKEYTIITDPGVDDIIALLLLLKLFPNAKHNIISTFGNVPEKFTSQNAKEFIAFLASHWSFKHGAKKPIQPLQYPWPTYFHGPDGVCGVHPKIQVKARHGKKGLISSHLVSLGPLTDVCEVMKHNKVESLTLMGGALHVPGNETPYAETNIAFDPDAATWVFSHCSCMKVSVIPLDVTKKVFWTKNDILKIPEDQHYQSWIRKMLLTWYDSFGGQRETVFHLHDPLAIFSIFFPDALLWTRTGIKVIKNGKKRGQMIASTTNPMCQVALEIKEPQKIAKKIFDIIFTTS